METNALELLIPLTYIPGVALLIMSTSQRYTNVNGIIHQFSDEECRIKTDRGKAGIKKGASIQEQFARSLFKRRVLFSWFTRRISCKQMGHCYLNIDTRNRNGYWCSLYSFRCVKTCRRVHSYSRYIKASCQAPRG